MACFDLVEKTIAYVAMWPLARAVLLVIAGLAALTCCVEAMSENWLSAALAGALAVRIAIGVSTSKEWIAEAQAQHAAVEAESASRRRRERIEQLQLLALEHEAANRAVARSQQGEARP